MFQRTAKESAQIISKAVGAEISGKLIEFNRQKSLEFRFDDLISIHSPVFSISPHGIKSLKLIVRLPAMVEDLRQQVNTNPKSSQEVAKSLFKHLMSKIGGSVTTDDFFNLVRNFDFDLKHFIIENNIELRSQTGIDRILLDVMAPLISAFIELIGYDEQQNELSYETQIEGAETSYILSTRERNPRNRLLCRSLHGDECFCCGSNPNEFFGRQLDVIEVHHIVPLATLEMERVYDPLNDLIPVCPNCHRALHKLEELPATKEKLRLCFVK